MKGSSLWDNKGLTYIWTVYRGNILCWYLNTYSFSSVQVSVIHYNWRHFSKQYPQRIDHLRTPSIMHSLSDLDQSSLIIVCYRSCTLKFQQQHTWDIVHGSHMGWKNWKSIFQSGKSHRILNALEHSGNFNQNTGKVREFLPVFIFIKVHWRM